MKNIIYVAVIFIWGCQGSDTGIISDSKKMEFESIHIIDTFSNKLVLDTASSITEADFHPMYIGEDKDSIFLNYWSGGIGSRSVSSGTYKRPDSNDVIIFVDTAQIIGSVNGFIIPPPPPSSKEFDEKEKWEWNYYRGETESYPIYVKNHTKDTLNVGYGEYIPLIIEAKDSLGIWKPIQEPYIYFCGTGLPYFYLPPDEIVIASCKLFKGNYITKMRIAFGYEGRTKSNEFVGKMNYKQFDEAKEEYY